jgi:excisionase family DNA binding protein
MVAASKTPVIEPLLITAPDAAKALALSERTLWTMAKTGQIQCVRQGRAVRFDPADLIAWRERNKTTLVAKPSNC